MKLWDKFRKPNRTCFWNGHLWVDGYRWSGPRGSGGWRKCLHCGEVKHWQDGQL